MFGLDGWQWALVLAGWMTLAGALCALWTAAVRIDRHARRSAEVLAQLDRITGGHR